MSGLAILLVHGYLGRPADFGTLAEILAPLADAVIALTLPGHDAEGTPPPPFARDAYLAQLAAAIDEQRAQARELILIGHSTGGSLLIAELARRAAAPQAQTALSGLRLLLLCATPPTLDLGYAERWAAHRGARPSTLDDLAALARLIRASGPDALTALPPELALHVVHGDADELVPVADGERWRRSERPFAFDRLAGSPHHLFHGPDAPAVRAAVRAAVAAHLPANAATLRRLAPELRLTTDPAPETVRHVLASPAGRRRLGRPLRVEAGGVADAAPTLANIEITTRCTLGCPACARTQRRDKSRHMPRATFERVLAALPHALRVTLVGLGEPLLHPEVVAFVRLAVEAGRHVELVSNAMALDATMGEALCAAGLAGITVSLDALTPEVAARVRPGSDLPLITANLRRFMALRQTLAAPPEVAIFTALRRDTVDELPAIVDFAAELGVGALMLSDLNFESNRADTLHAYLDAAPDAAARLRAALRQAARRGLPVFSVRALEELDLPRRPFEHLLLRGDTLAERSPTRSHCYSPWQTVPVKVDGRFSFCDCQPETVIGDLLASPVETLWNGPRLRELRHQMHAAPSPACLACPRF